jgi:ADP-heptose:LPS heptosyltransferase
VVTIFGPTDPVQLLPLSDNVQIVKTSVSCAPCYFGIFKGCRTGLENCMKDVPVSGVFAVVQKCMAGGEDK